MLLTRQFLENLCVQLDDNSYALLAEHFETTLHERVIDQIIEELSPEQVKELATLQEANDSALDGWLQANVPDLAEIVTDEVTILLGEVAEDSDKL